MYRVHKRGRTNCVPRTSVYQESGEESWLCDPDTNLALCQGGPADTMKEELHGRRTAFYVSIHVRIGDRGHPDKICDQISDAILDAILEKETELQKQGYISPSGQPADVSKVRCACETMTTTGMVVVAGEIRTQAYVDVPTIVRNVICEIGYDRAKYRLRWHEPAGDSERHPRAVRPTLRRASTSRSRRSTARRKTSTRRSVRAIRA